MCGARSGSKGRGTQKYPSLLQTHTPFIWGLGKGQPRTELPGFSLLGWKSPSKGLGRRLVPSGSGLRPHGPAAGKGPSTLTVTPRPRALAQSRCGWAGRGVGEGHPGQVLPPPSPVTWTRLPQPGVLSGTNHEEERGRRRGQWVSAPRGRWAGPTAPSRPASQSAGAGGGPEGARAAPRSAP